MDKHSMKRKPLLGWEREGTYMYIVHSVNGLGYADRINKSGPVTYPKPKQLDVEFITLKNKSSVMCPMTTVKPFMNVL